MPAPNESDRRFTLALTAAVAATTVALGVTAATLLGWFRTSEPPPQTATAAPAAPALVYVPIAPTTPSEPPAATPADPGAERLAMDDRDDDEHEHERHHEEREHDDD
ncbi:MAG TPA: hypothetical protein VLT45_29020 [Kofleriaceae bacterium]|nr:hypothetical protein [Kofleriaceae bacterium]